MTHEEVEELIARRVAEEMEACEVARNLEALNENEEEQKGKNGGNENRGNRGSENKDNGGNGNKKRTIGVDDAYAMKWAGLIKLMTEVYCPRNEVQMMEAELWNLTVKGNDLTAYIQRLPDNILGNVIAANPARLQDAIRIANQLMDKKLKGYAARSAENKRRMESNPRDNRGQQPPFKRHNTTGKCKLHHEGLCTIRCGNCKKVGHQTRDCRVTVNPNTQGATVGNQQGVDCDECGRPGHFKKDCPKLRNQNCGNQTRNKTGNKTGGDDCDGRSKLNIISSTKTRKYIQKGCQVYLAQVTSKKAEDKSEEKRLEDVPIVMAAPVISISSDVSVESARSSFLRVILIGSISFEVLVAPEVRTAVVASPARVLELDTHLSSKTDPLESSPPPVSVAPTVSSFLCLDDSESDTEIPERHVSPTPHDAMLTRWRRKVASRSSSPTTSTPDIPTAPILLAPSAIVAPSSEFPLAHTLTARKSVRPLPFYRLALRYTSHPLDHFTFGSSSSHLSSDHSSSGHFSLGRSLSGHTPPDTTIDADSSTPSRFVHPPLARTPRSKDSSFESSAGPSCKRCRSHAATVTSSIHATRALVPSRANLLLPRKRFRDSISPEDSVEVDIDTDVLEDIKADAAAVEVVVDRDVEVGIDADIGMKVDVGIDVEDEVESSDRGTMMGRVDVIIGIDIPDGMLMPDAVERLEELMKLIAEVYCLRNEIQKIESKLWNLTVKNNDLAAYTQIFQELTRMCTKMVLEEEDQVKKFIGGHPDNIHGNVIAAEPMRLQDAVRIATNLMDQKLKGYAVKNAENKRRLEVNQRDNRDNGPLPLCNRCKLHHEGPCTMRCGKWNKVGHLTRDCKVTNSTTLTQRGQIVNQRVVTCFECGRHGHYMSDFLKLKDQNRRNKAGNKNSVGEARGKAYVLGGGCDNPRIFVY
nr:hypothetical protein [Tanacetum cinerariifolium]